MFCPRCGKEISDQSSFCQFCGGNVKELITPGAPPDDMQTIVDNNPTQAAAEEGRYQQRSLIGIGGMGHVYKAYDTVMEEWIALKTLPPELNHDPKLLALFIREARHTRKLAHPNIIRVHDVVEIAGVNYISMEYVDGGDLKAYLRDHQPLKFEAAAKLLYQIASALNYSHAQNIIHRDLKPQNILLRQDLQVKISDFGIAKALDDTGVTKSGVMGTAAYMSPEHLGQGSLDQRSDLYSLGVILFEMLTSEMPFKADTPVGLGIKHLQDAPPSPRLLRADVPVLLEQATLCCLAKKPEERFQSAKDLLLFLRKQQPTAPAPPPAPPRVEAPAPPRVKEPEEAIETMEAEQVTNSVGIKLRLIPAGEFMMGSDRGADNERAAHRVRFTYSFYLGITPVTQQEYQRVMGNNPSRFKADLRPVENVSWAEARKFCQLLSQREGVSYRLPSEAEWEYAARAGTATEYWWGDNFQRNACFCKLNSPFTTNPVGRLKPNPWSLVDTAGNVWEWCEDGYRPVYSAETQVNPVPPAAAAERVIRGGAFNSEYQLCRSSARAGLAASKRQENVGFRVVRELDPQRRNGKLLIRLIRGDISTRRTDAVVNPTNRSLSMSGSVSRSLLVAGGPELSVEIKKYSSAGFGAVVKTAAGKLPARFIYHAVINEREALCQFPELIHNLVIQAGFDRIENLTMPLLGMALAGIEPENALTMILDGLIGSVPALEKELAADLVILDPQLYHRLMPLFHKHRPAQV
jgi:eukaryotic-like serine/threonine-protein kinase